MDKIIDRLKPGDTGTPVTTLQEALELLGADDDEMSALLGQLHEERRRESYGVITSKLVAQFQRRTGLNVTGVVDVATSAALNAALSELRDLEPEATVYIVNGVVTAHGSASVGGLVVRIVDKGIGGDVLLAETKTDPQGLFQTSVSAEKVHSRGKTDPDFQAHVIDGEHHLGSSVVHYDAPTEVKLDIVLDAGSAKLLASEHDTLSADLARHTAERLADLKENAERQDITWLANKSGWDARVVAIAALSDRLARNVDGIAAPYFYALLRAGLPAEPDALFRTDPTLVRQLWGNAVKEGVLSTELESGIDGVVEQFTVQAGHVALDSKPVTGLSTMSELVAESIDNVDDQQRFAALVAKHATEPDELWRNVEEVLGGDKAKELQFVGRLAFLTLNNAPLITKLRSVVGEELAADRTGLVRAGLYRIEPWEELLDDSVPKEFKGSTLNERRTKYARFLAAQVRLGYPTAVVGEMVGRSEMPVKSEQLREEVNRFLHLHAGTFELAAQPVARYVVKKGITATPELLSEITRLQRVFQITPTEESMAGLLRAGIDSATQVVRYTEKDFVGTYAAQLGGEQEARLIHAKSRQVHGAVLNIAMGYLTQRGAAPIGVHSPAAFVNPVPVPPANAEDVLAVATLESVFGEMDFCTCEHCRSVLSPAAYLVDLLMFLDAPASRIPTDKRNPQTVLLDRRPDIQHLPLTCENTHTPLPYIDLVNETLESFVAAGLSLGGFEGYDTDPGIPPEEFLASPQNVSAAAYSVLTTIAYPYPLPFHRLLEMHRRILAKFATPLPALMAELRVSDELERGAQNYGVRDLRMERLGISRAEHALLTASWPTAGPPDVVETAAWLHGIDPGAGATAVRALLQGAKSYARRASITYEELVRIMRTRFINPGAALIPKLERLGVSVVEIKELADGTVPSLTYSPGVDPAEYGGIIDAWLIEPDRLSRIMGLLTLRNPGDATDICDFSAVEFRYSEPDPTANEPRFIEFIRLARFIRLWKTLGWSIEETDEIIAALSDMDFSSIGPGDESAALAELDAGFERLIPRIAIALDVMEALELSVERDLGSVLALFAPISAHGRASLYARMFLSRPQADPAFATDADGTVLTNATEMLFDHAEALRAAFGLRDGEVGVIFEALAYDGSTPLALSTISAVYRRGWLARQLGLSVQELVALVQVSGLSPFGLPHPVTPDLMQLIGRARTLRSSNLSPGDALAIFWNRTFAPEPSGIEPTIATLARDLRTALVSVKNEFAMENAPDATTARTLMGLAYPSATVDLFFGAIEQTVGTSTGYDHTAERLEPAILTTSQGHLDYDDFAKELSYNGIMSVAVRDALRGIADLPADFSPAIDSLYASSQALFAPLFARHPELAVLHDTYVDSADSVTMRLGALITSFIPELVARRKRQQIIPIIAAAANSETPLIDPILNESAVLHAVGDAARPALDDFIALDNPGLSAAFHFTATFTGPPAENEDAILPEFATGTDRPLPKPPGNPAAQISVRLTGSIEAEADELYQIRIETDPGATVRLWLSERSVNLADDGGGVFTVPFRQACLTSILS